MENCDNFVQKWEEVKGKGKTKYIFFSNLLIDYIIGIPFFLIMGPFFRSGCSIKYLKVYLSSTNVLSNACIYFIAISILRVVYRFCSWYYKENKYNDIKEHDAYCLNNMQ